MAEVKFLLDITSDAAAISGGSWLSISPVANVQDRDGRKKARSTSTAVAHTQFRLDGGSVPKKSWQFVYFENFNASESATYTIVLTDSATDVEGERISVQGPFTFWKPTMTFGTLPWGYFPWSGIDPSAYADNPVAYEEFAEAITAQYMFVYISDVPNPDGYFDLGRFIAGQLQSFGVNYLPNQSVKFIDPSEVTRTRGGRRVLASRPTHKVFSLSFDWLSADLAYGPIFDWMKAGKKKEVLVLLNTDDPAEIRFKRTIRGSLIDASQIDEPRNDIYSLQLQIEEV